MNSNIDVSFITINYNSSNYTKKLIESIGKYCIDNYELIIVDNASNEKDFNLLNKYVKNNKRIKLIKNSINSGFASGNMIGAKVANGKYLFFINNDVELLNNCGEIFKKFLDKNSDVALLTGKVNDEKGNFSSSYKLFPSLIKELFGNSMARKLSKYKFPSNKIILDKPTCVEVVSGSCMFFRAKDFFEIKGFDTEFFLYCEEEDISKRVWSNNKKVMFLPEAKILHFSGGSTKQSFEIEREYYISYKHLVFKHYNKVEAFILMFLQINKLFRRSYKRKNGFKLLIFALKGFNKSQSLKYK